MSDLIKRLEALDAPCRELFDEAFVAIHGQKPPSLAGYSKEQSDWFTIRNSFSKMIQVGAWLDAAMMLLPKGYAVNAIQQTAQAVKDEHTGDIPLADWSVVLIREDCAGYRNRNKFRQAFEYGDATTAAIAFCIAALKAQEASHDGR